MVGHGHAVIGWLYLHTAVAQLQQRGGEPDGPELHCSSQHWHHDGLGGGCGAGGGDAWSWISTNPTPYSGSLAQQSVLANGEHQHYFYNAAATLAVAVGDTLF